MQPAYWLFFDFGPIQGALIAGLVYSTVFDTKADDLHGCVTPVIFHEKLIYFLHSN